MAVTLPLEVCVNDLPSRISVANENPVLNLNFCVNIPVQDLVTALIKFQNRQETVVAEAPKAPLKSDTKAAQPPGLVPVTSTARSPETLVSTAANPDTAASTPGVPAVHGAPASTAAAAPAVAPPEALAAAAPPAVAPGLISQATATTSQKPAPGWKDCISKMQPWHHEYTKKMSFQYPQGSGAPMICKAAQLLRDLMLDDFDSPNVALKELSLNKPPPGYAPMPDALMPAPPASAPPARPEQSASTAVAAAPPGPGSSAEPYPKAPACPAPAPAGPSTTTSSLERSPELVTEPGYGDAYEPESEDVSTASAAAPNLPPEAPPPPPPGMAAGGPPPGLERAPAPPPPGLAPPAPRGPAPAGAVGATPGQAPATPGVADGTPTSNQQKENQQKECKQQ